MNLFLPYEMNVRQSVMALDDKRLNKQILECQTLLDKDSGYKNHPVYVFYKDNPQFIAYYGLQACKEYTYRFGKRHSLQNLFEDEFSKYSLLEVAPVFTPYYMEGSINTKDCIRTTDNVSELFQTKLRNKWNNDIANDRKPKWTKRQIPSFYQIKEN